MASIIAPPAQGRRWRTAAQAGWLVASHRSAGVNPAVAVPERENFARSEQLRFRDRLFNSATGPRPSSSPSRLSPKGYVFAEKGIG